MSIRLIQDEQRQALQLCLCARAERQMTIAHNDKKLLDIITANFMRQNKAESDSAAQEWTEGKVCEKKVGR